MDENGSYTEYADGTIVVRDAGTGTVTKYHGRSSTSGSSSSSGGKHGSSSSGGKHGGKHGTRHPVASRAASMEARRPAARTLVASTPAASTPAARTPAGRTPARKTLHRPMTRSRNWTTAANRTRSRARINSGATAAAASRAEQAHRMSTRGCTNRAIRTSRPMAVMRAAMFRSLVPEVRVAPVPGRRQRSHSARRFQPRRECCAGRPARRKEGL